MSRAEWTATFLEWYEKMNRACVDSKESMRMVQVLEQKFHALSIDEKRWLVDLMREWQDSGNQFKKYDCDVLLSKFEAALSDA